MSAPTRTIVLGGTGYVAGELLRLLAVHPFLREVAVISESQPGKRVEEVFPHLAGAFPDLVFQGGESLERLVGENDHVAVFSAAPHGASAPLLDRVLDQAERSGARANLVDLSADFRYPTALEYERVYGHPHGAPGRIGSFVSAVPELATGPGFAGARHVCLPGCFTTAVLLAVVPLLRLGLIEPRFSVVAVTGSTGAGRTPTATTHHPERRSNVFAYNPLGHRHEPEMRLHASAAAGAPVEIAFVPQSGPYARGIYATIQARTARPTTTAQAVAELAAFYAGSPFVAVGEKPPRLQDV
ncbi:MAG TPA: hypothetical protein VN783_11930, partial [Thermoanaerobaculia bacterium]|nr:hypothetical protein [Thermoanaerobaculia bacterium]